MQTLEAYNNWANTYDTVENKTRDLELIAAKQVLASADCSHVIEIGCGTGKNTSWLCERATTITAVDFSEGMLNVARPKVSSSNVHFVQGDITEPWQFEKASLVVCSLVLEHIRDIDFIFSQVVNILNDGGCFYICELHPYKQLLGSQARFTNGETVVNIEYFVHHLSDFISCAAKYNLRYIDLQEWFDNNDRRTTPRLVSFLFKK